MWAPVFIVSRFCQRRQAYDRNISGSFDFCFVLFPRLSLIVLVIDAIGAKLVIAENR